MSRLAKKPLALKNGVTIDQKDGFAIMKGPKGELQVRIPSGVELEVKPEGIMVSSSSDSNKALVGTTWSLLGNAIDGVAEGYKKVLEIEGVGYRAQVEGQNLVLSLGYVNPVKFPMPKGITITVEKNVISVSGIDKELVGMTAAQIRALKKPEPYKGKGIHYQGEVIRRKAGKKATATAG